MESELHPTKLRLLEVAFRLFHEQGYHATGVSTILREAGVNSGSMYHYFPSKEALLLGVLEWMLGALKPLVMAPVEAQSSDPFERVFGLLGQYRAGLELTGCRMGCPAGNLALEVSDDHPEARALIDANFKNWAAQVAGWFESEQGGRLPSDFDAPAFSRFVLTVMEGGIMQARAAGSLEPFDESVAQLRRFVDLLRSGARGVAHRSDS